MTDRNPAYVAELHAAEGECPDILADLSFDADTPSAAKRRMRNWVAVTIQSYPGATWVRLRLCGKILFDKPVADLLGPAAAMPNQEAALASVRPRAPEPAEAEALSPKLLQPILAGLDLARSALTSR